MMRHGVNPSVLPTGRTADSILNGRTPAANPTSPRAEASVPTTLPGTNQDTLGTVTLRMYNPEDRSQISSLLGSFVGERNLNQMAYLFDSQGEGQKTRMRSETARKKRHEGLGVDPDKYDELRATQLNELAKRVKIRVNKHVYAVIQQSLGLATPREAADIFQSERRVADRAVDEHAKLVFPEEAGIKIRKAVREARNPADLLELALKATDPVLRFELRRQFVNTVLALQEMQGRSRKADDKITQIRDLFNDKLYAGPATVQTFYGLFDNETNALEGEISRTRSRRPTPGKHYKTLTLPVRTLKSGVEVVEIVSQKEEGASIRKALRKAHERRAAKKSDRVTIGEDVKDKHRMNLAVIGNKQQAHDVATEVYDLITNPESSTYFHDTDLFGSEVRDARQQPTGLLIDADEITGPRGGFGQSGKIVDPKLAFVFDCEPSPATIKVSFPTLESFIAGQLEVGTYDPINARFTGAAHSLYAIQREPINDVSFFPEGAYPRLRRRYRESNGVPQPHLADTAKSLRRVKTFSLN